MNINPIFLYYKCYIYESRELELLHRLREASEVARKDGNYKNRSDFFLFF